MTRVGLVHLTTVRLLLLPNGISTLLAITYYYINPSTLQGSTPSFPFPFPWPLSRRVHLAHSFNSSRSCSSTYKVKVKVKRQRTTSNCCTSTVRISLSLSPVLSLTALSHLPSQLLIIISPTLRLPSSLDPPPRLGLGRHFPPSREPPPPPFLCLLLLGWWFKLSKMEHQMVTRGRGRYY